MNHRQPVTLPTEADPEAVTFDMGVDSYGPFILTACGDDVMVATMTTSEVRDLANRLLDFAARVDAYASIIKARKTLLD